MKIVLVCSSGGHLQELVRLCPAWEEYDHVWVTFPGLDTDELLAGERVCHASHPTNRNPWNLLRNTWMAWRLLRRERPELVISTGAGVAVPFFFLGRLLGMHTIFIESFTRIDDLSLTGKLVYPFSDRFLVQWPQLAARYRKAEFGGTVF